MEKFFEFEKIEYLKQVNLAWTELEGNAFLWCDNVELDKKRKGKQKIKTSHIMVSKLKGKFIPIDYTLNLYVKLQMLTLKDVAIKIYI